MTLQEVKTEALFGSTIKSEHIRTLVDSVSAAAYINTYYVDSTMSVSAIQTIVDFASSGQVVKFTPGTYDFGDSSLILKNGVNFDCDSNVTFTSSASAGTIKDNNVSLTSSLRGFPIIVNTNITTPLAKRIVLQNAGSIINDFWWELFFYAVSGEAGIKPYVIVFSNNLGVNPDFVYNTSGSYRWTVGLLSTRSIFYIVVSIVKATTVLGEPVAISVGIANGVNHVFDIIASNGDEILSNYFSIKIYP